MSFRCEDCNKAQVNGSAPVRKVVATRKKVYAFREYKKGLFFIKDPGGVGVETVREAILCSDCNAK